MAGHARRGVHFQQEEAAAAAIAHHVHAPPATATGGTECGQRDAPDFFFVVTVQARAQILGVFGDVLGVVVVPLALGHDADRRQRDVAKDGHGQLIADHHLLHQQLAVVARGQRHGLIQARIIGHPADAHAGTFVGRLHHHRQAQFGRQRMYVRRVDLPVLRGRQAQRQPHLLGADLVHAQRRTQHVRAGVRHAEGVHQALHDAVLTTTVVAMQDVEHAIDATGGQRLGQRRDAVHGKRIDAA
ncbi:hypothetical protein SprV_0502033500 [Sparganum proliferum]